MIQELLRRVEDGERFTIDFEKRSLKIGREMLIDNGIVADGYELDMQEKWEFIDPIDKIERHYHNYKYSRPAEHEYGKYFKALKADEMTDEELILGQNRELMRAKLEWYILNMLLVGFTWEDITEPNHWYWESKKENGLVLLKKWFGGEVNG